MPPNTPHAVLSPTNSIFQGSHFYSLTTMRDTLAGLVHMLVQEKYITNTSHPPLRMMIRKVVAYVHAVVFPHPDAKVDSIQCFDPKTLTSHTMTYLFVVISLGFLCNILDPRTYRIRPDDVTPTQEEKDIHDKFDYNAMPASERRGCIWTRGMSMDLAQWFYAHYDLKCPGKEDASPENIVYDAVAHEAFGVFVAATSVEAVEERRGLCAVGATSKMIRHQLERLDNHPMVKNQIKSLLKRFNNGETERAFNLLYDWSNWTCHAKTPSELFKPYSDQDVMKWGCTTLDIAYMKG